MSKDQQYIDLLNVTTEDLFNMPKGSITWHRLMGSDGVVVANVNVPTSLLPTIDLRKLNTRSASEFCKSVINAIADAALNRFKAVRKALKLPEYREYVVHKTVGTVQRRPYAKSRSGRYML